MLDAKDALEIAKMRCPGPQCGYGLREADALITLGLIHRCRWRFLWFVLAWFGFLLPPFTPGRAERHLDKWLRYRLELWVSRGILAAACRGEKAGFVEIGIDDIASDGEWPPTYRQQVRLGRHIAAWSLYYLDKLGYRAVAEVADRLYPRDRAWVSLVVAWDGVGRKGDGEKA